MWVREMRRAVVEWNRVLVVVNTCRVQPNMVVSLVPKAITAMFA